ncbi:hypothetical protein F5Y19DRAFT_443727 [Xylariaceae sp. FL1651]|nr:hypothetical protein F5Y19DRAFT_443727 [Xylariaceae sp. FL1651]
MTMEELVEFIWWNGSPSFRWPRSSKTRFKARNQTENDFANTKPSPFVLPPLPTTAPPMPTQKIRNTHAVSPLQVQLTHANTNPWSQYVWDKSFELVVAPPREAAHTAVDPQPQSPTLSFICRQGWDLNNKATWAHATGVDHTVCPLSSQTLEAKALAAGHPIVLTPASVIKSPEYARLRS